MNLIWTLDFNNEIKGALPGYKNKLIDFYTYSIMSAKKLGYKTIIYTNKACANHFENLVDEMIILEDYEKSVFFDSFKFKVLEDRCDDYYLIDGDVILESKLPVYDVDVTFDAYETKHFNETYRIPILELIDIDVKNELPIKLDPNGVKIMNCGVLRITNNTLKSDYIKLWKLFNEFVNRNIKQIKNDQTAISAQYLLTNLVNNNNYSNQSISLILGKKNQYYKHYHGGSKYKVEKIISGKKELI